MTAAGLTLQLVSLRSAGLALRAVVALAFAAGWSIASAQAPDFRRDVLPILSDSCFACHGPDGAARQAGLRLDLPGVAADAGLIVPGEADVSALIERIESPDPDVHMPPPGTRKDLTADQRSILRRWIDAGATYEQHWAWQVPVRPAVPAAGDGWAKNPIDRFIAARHGQSGLKPAPRAEAATLLRRLQLDLTGLPPGESEWPDRDADGGEAGYAATVARLLASPHHGERMASRWLDLVRYADTVGYHGDQNQNVFPYRDWVVSAINDNLPYDQFVTWQLAGDLIENPTVASRTATAFNRLNMVTREGGAQPDEYLAKYAADRVRTVGTALLGTTLGCAECHDHKFDPFTTRDFYSMAAFFADIRQWGVYQDYEYTPNPDLRGWSNDHPFPPELEVEAPALHRKISRLNDQRRQLVEDAIAQSMTEPETERSFNSWCEENIFSLPPPENGWADLKLATVAKDQTGEPDRWIQGHDGLLTKSAGETATVKLEFDSPPMQVASLRLEFPGDPEKTGDIAPSDHSTNLQLQLWRHFPEVAARKPERIVMHHAAATTSLPRFANGFEIDGIQQGWSLRGSFPAGTAGVWVLDAPLRLGPGESLSVTLTGNLARSLRFSASPFVLVEPDGTEIKIPKPAESAADAAERDRLNILWRDFAVGQWLLTAADQLEARASLRQLDAEIRQCRNGKWPVLVTEAMPEPRVTRVLPRGNWQDTSGDVVAPGTPGFLPGFDLPADGKRLSRLDLARWLFRDDNPLTARAEMNRLWAHFFGVGLSPVLEDLGAQGQYPSHPELLDWLAVEFRESGWDRRHIIRLIVNSATYQQSSQADPESLARDPDNRLLSRQRPRRLEAEIVRDNALAVAGLLNPEIGGPPVFPWQPAGYYAQLQFPDRDYQPSRDADQHRRGLYMHWQRTFLQPMLANFDAPSREECTGQRIEANTPQQALTLLNDPTFVEAARRLAERTFAEPSGSEPTDPDSIVAGMLRRVLFREATAAETDSLVRFLESQRDHFRSTPADAGQLIATGLGPPAPDTDPVELAARTALARVLLNLHETITRN